MDKSAKNILIECKYENLTVLRFNLHDFDIEVNCSKRTINHVIENLDHIPSLDFEASGANVIKFKKECSKGGYGVLYDVR